VQRRILPIYFIVSTVGYLSSLASQSLIMLVAMQPGAQKSYAATNYEMPYYVNFLSCLILPAKMKQTK